MVIIGGDSHKRTHTFVVLDAVGRRLDEKTVPATTDGHLAALSWAAQWAERRWALEDCRHLTGVSRAICSVPVTRLCGCHRR